MTTLDKIVSTNEARAVDDNTQGATQKSQTEVFSNPQEFMSVLSSNYSKLKGGRDGVRLNDLKIDGEDSSLDPKVRAAAKIAADHFEALQNMGKLSLWNRPSSGSVLTKDEIDLAKDVVNDKILGHIVTDTAYGTLAGVGIGLTGLTGVAGGGIMGYVSVAESVGPVAIGASAMLAASGLAVVGLGGLFGYEGVTAYNHYKSAVKDNQAEMNRWL